MEKEKQKLIFQNRRAFIRDRGLYMQKTYDLVEDLVNNFEITFKKTDGPEELLGRVEDLVKILHDARDFGFLSIGGNATNPPSFVEPKEFALIDHISVMYSLARSISKLLSHECAVRTYERHHSVDDKRLQKYITDIEEEDHKLILQQLTAMKTRMDVFNEFYGNINR